MLTIGSVTIVDMGKGFKGWRGVEDLEGWRIGEGGSLS